MTPQQEQLGRLGFYAVAPFVVSAAIMWLSPILIPQWVALNIHTLILAYGGVFAAFLAGAGAASSLHAGEPSRAAPFAIAAFFAWLSIWPSGFLTFSIQPVWRYLILIFVFGWLAARDASPVPSWYGSLRLRLAFWTSISLVLVMARLISWRYF